MDSSIIPDLNTLIAGATIMEVFGRAALNLSSSAVSSLSVRVGKQLKEWALGKKITEQELQEKIERYNQSNKRGSALFRQHISQACVQLAHEIEGEKRITETDVRYPLLHLLGDSVFHQAIGNWVLTADLEQKQIYQQYILDTLKNQCAPSNTDPAVLQNLSETMNQIEEELYNDPLLFQWYQGIQMSYVVKGVASLEKGTASIQKDTTAIREAQNEQRGIYPQDVLDAALHEYWETVSKQFETISDLTARNELPLPLDEFYMPLFLRIETKVKDGSTIRKPIPLEKLEWTSSPWMILGNAGDGKSTTFRWLVHKAFRDWKKKQDCLASGQHVPYQDMMFQGKLPIPLLCKDMNMEGDCTIGKILASYMTKMKWVDEGEYADARNAPLYKAVWREINAGCTVLLIDGLDELKDQTWQEHYHQSQRAELLKELIRYMQRYESNLLVVSSRPFVLKLLADDLRQRYRIGNLISPAKDAKITMITHWVDSIYSDDNHYSEGERARYKETLIEAVTDKSSISSLTDSPLMLSMLLIAFKTDGKIPATEREIYEKAISHFIYWNEENHFQLDTKRTKLLKSKERRQKSILAQLEYLALEMWIENIHRLDVIEAEEMLNNFRNQLQNIKSSNKPDLNHEIEDLLLYLQQNSGLFFPVTFVENNGKEETWWEFRHLAFRDYLAACAIHHGYYIRNGKSLSIVEFVKAILFNSSGELASYWEQSPRKIISLVHSFYPDREERNGILDQIDSLFVSVSNYIFSNYYRYFIPRWEGTREELVADFHKKTCVSCARALANKTGDEVTAALLKGLDDENSVVRFICARALANKTGDEVTAGLLKGLDDEDWDVRSACAGALATRSGEEVTAALLKGLDEEKSDIRCVCAEALANKTGDEVTAALLKGLDDGDGYVRVACAKSLANKSGEEVTAALLKGLDDGDRAVRSACAGALATRSGEEVTAALLKGLDDEDWDVRSACAGALATRSGEEVTAVLLKGLDDEDGDVRSACAGALATRSGEEVTAALLKGLDDEDWDVRSACAGALATRSGEEVTAALLKGLDDEDEYVRSACAEALENRSGGMSRL